MSLLFEEVSDLSQLLRIRDNPVLSASSRSASLVDMLHLLNAGELQLHTSFLNTWWGSIEHKRIHAAC